MLTVKGLDMRQGAIVKTIAMKLLEKEGRMREGRRLIGSGTN